MTANRGKRGISHPTISEMKEDRRIFTLSGYDLHHIRRGLLALSGEPSTIIPLVEKIEKMIRRHRGMTVITCAMYDLPERM